MPPNVKVLICGDPRNHELLPVPDNQKMFQPFIPYDEWAKMLSKRFDIGIAPLAGEYDNYRSWIKPVEYCLTKTPWIGTRGPAYAEFENYGTLVDNGVDNWTTALLNKIDNYAQEKEFVCGKPYQHGLSTDVNTNVEKIADIYREIAKVHAKLNI